LRARWCSKACTVLWTTTWHRHRRDSERRDRTAWPGDGGQLPERRRARRRHHPAAPPPQGARPSAFAESFVRLVPLRVMRGDGRSTSHPTQRAAAVVWIDIAVFVFGSLAIIVSRPRASLHVRVATAARWRPASRTR